MKSWELPDEAQHIPLSPGECRGPAAGEACTGSRRLRGGQSERGSGDRGRLEEGGTPWAEDCRESRLGMGKEPKGAGFGKPRTAGLARLRRAGGVRRGRAGGPLPARALPQLPRRTAGAAILACRCWSEAPTPPSAPPYGAGAPRREGAARVSSWPDRNVER